MADEYRLHEFAQKFRELCYRMDNQCWIEDEDMRFVTYLINYLGGGSVFDVVHTCDYYNTEGMQMQTDQQREKDFIILDPNNIEALASRARYSNLFDRMTDANPLIVDSDDDLISFLEKELQGNTVERKKDNQSISMHDVLKMLGIEDTEEKWLDGKSVILIPVHGPHLTMECHTIEDFAKRNHWSLLCYWIEEKTIFHYDSIQGSNTRRAKEVISLLQFFGVLPGDIKEKMSIDFIPGQAGTWECGYFTIMEMVIIVAKSPPRPISKKDVEARCGCFNSRISCTLKDLVTKLAREKLIQDSFT
jgi:hypothetical protein